MLTLTSLLIGLSTPAYEPPVASTLSWFERKGGDARWIEGDPATGKRRLVATLPGDPTNARVFWAPGGAKAIVLVREPARLFQVALHGGAVTALPPLPAGTPEAVRFGAGGAITALAIDRVPVRKDAKGEHFTFAGKRYPAGAPIGLPALAHAFRLTGAGWTRTETTNTTTDACDTTGVLALKAGQDLPPDLLAPDVRLRGDEPPAGPVAAGLKRLAGKAEGAWIGVPGATPMAYAFVDGEYATGLAAVRGKAGPRALALGAKAGGVVAYAARGPWLLAAPADEEKATLVDLRTGKAVGTAGIAASFWPLP